MKIIYLDCFSGVSGDMLLGALVDAGVAVEDLNADLERLGITGLRLEVSEVTRAGIRARAVRVAGGDAAATRSLADAEQLLSRSALDAGVRELAARTFRRLAEAEAGAHGCRPEEVHFHELGGADTIADVVGVICGFKRLAPDAVTASPVNVGSGVVQSAHGVFPVPAPATAALLRGVPVYSNFAGELTTPTGALLVTALASSFGPMPPMRLSRAGHGAGGREAAHPNILRLFVGETVTAASDSDIVYQVETNIDDMNPEIYGLMFNRLLDAGALDVYLTPVQMKKNRPGLLLTAVCPEAVLAEVTDTLFRETTTLGVRYSMWGRLKLERRVRRVDTAFGAVRVKIALLKGLVRNAAPEYDDCVRQAEAAGAGVLDVMREAAREAAVLFPAGSPDPGEE